MKVVQALDDERPWTWVLPNQRLEIAPIRKHVAHETAGVIEPLLTPPHLGHVPFLPLGTLRWQGCVVHL